MDLATDGSIFVHGAERRLCYRLLNNSLPVNGYKMRYITATVALGWERTFGDTAPFSAPRYRISWNSASVISLNTTLRKCLVNVIRSLALGKIFDLS
jgi:hypothetical protein